MSLLKNRPHRSMEGDQVTGSGMTYCTKSQVTSAMHAIEIFTVLIFYCSHHFTRTLPIYTLTASKIANSFVHFVSYVVHNKMSRFPLPQVFYKHLIIMYHI